MRKVSTLTMCAAMVVAVGLTPAVAGAQEAMPRMEFEAAVQQALANNPSVAAAATSITRAEALLQQARVVMRPSISVGATGSMLDSERGSNGIVSQPRSQVAFVGNVSMTVLAPARWAAVAQARDQIEVARNQTDEVRQQIAVAAAQTYLAVFGQKRQVEILIRSLETAQAHLKYAQDRLAAGAGTRLNELRASQSVSSDEARLENARLSLRRTQEALGVILAADGPVDVGAEPALDVEAVGSPAEWMLARPDIRRRTAEIEAAKRVVADGRRDWYPTAALSFDPQYLTPTGTFQASRSWRLALSFTQPLFDGGQRRAARALRQTTLDQLTLSLTSVQIDARAEVRIAQVAADSAQRSLAAARRAAAQADEVLRITSVVFEVGATTNIEVIDAQRTARDADTVAVQAEDAWRQARLDLLVALGRFPR